MMALSRPLPHNRRGTLGPRSGPILNLFSPNLRQLAESAADEEVLIAGESRVCDETSATLYS